MNTPYTPPRWAKNGHIQSLLTSSPARKHIVLKRTKVLRREAKRVELNCVGGITLEGFYNPAKSLQNTAGKVDIATQCSKAPLVILIHGWEGSADSTYLLSATQRLHQAGFATFRLNLRDHGDTHHLNEEIFNFCHLAEVVDAVKQVHQRYQPSKLFLAGFSLGGNFSLRVAAQAHEHDIPLDKVVSICAPMHPHGTTKQLKDMKVYNTYFVRKWKQSLKKKVTLFPERYAHTTFLSQRDLWNITQHLLPYMSQFESVSHYFDSYALANDTLANVRVPTTVLLAKDDPIIDHHDSELMSTSAQVNIVKTDFGGHCGFFKNRKLESWVDDYLVDTFSAYL